MPPSTVSEQLHLWYVDLNLDPSTIEREFGILSASERVRADGFRFEEHRRDYVGAHAALRRILGRYLISDPAAVAFEAGAHGKPRLAGESSADDLRFNLSHTKGAALIGVTGGREIGVDIEEQRPVPNLEDLAVEVLSAEELVIFLGLDREVREAVFYRHWTRKEAFLKATGDGLNRSPVSVTIPAGAVSGPGDLEVYVVRDLDQWSIFDVAVPRKFAAAVCCEGALPSSITLSSFNFWTNPV